MGAGGNTSPHFLYLTFQTIPKSAAIKCVTGEEIQLYSSIENNGYTAIGSRVAKGTRMRAGLILAFAMVLSAGRASADTAAKGDEDARIAAAQANIKLVKTPVALVNQPVARLPAEAKSAGAHGTVVVRGLIGPDGRFADLRVIKSGRSTILDQFALQHAAAIQFSPARDAEGNALTILARMEIELEGAIHSGGGTMATYTCAQLLIDENWWAKNWPDQPEDKLHKLLRVFATSPIIHSYKNPADYDTAGAAFEAKWQKALVKCQSQPDALLVNILKPEAGAILALEPPAAK